MPYYVFEIQPGNAFNLLDSSRHYREARDVARDRRKSLPPDSQTSVKMIFAADPAQGISLLSAKRQPRPLGEEV